MVLLVDDNVPVSYTTLASADSADWLYIYDTSGGVLKKIAPNATGIGSGGSSPWQDDGTSVSLTGTENVNMQNKAIHNLDFISSGTGTGSSDEYIDLNIGGSSIKHNASVSHQFFVNGTFEFEFTDALLDMNDNGVFDAKYYAFTEQSSDIVAGSNSPVLYSKNVSSNAELFYDNDTESAVQLT